MAMRLIAVMFGALALVAGAPAAPAELRQSGWAGLSYNFV